MTDSQSMSMTKRKANGNNGMNDGTGGTKPLQGPNQQAGADDDTSDEKVDEAVAHDVFRVKARDSQGRERPERLYEIGPCVTPCNGHARQTWVNTQVGSGRKHHRCLHCPMAAATGHKHIEHCSAKEGEQGIGDGIADADASIGHDAAQADATDADACNDAHDAGIEGELQYDARCAASGFPEGTHVIDWSGMQ